MDAQPFFLSKILQACSTSFFRDMAQVASVATGPSASRPNYRRALTS
jgi:hypothetical protein